jgi:hypothetical protein
LLLFSISAHAQQARLLSGDPPHYINVPIDIQVVAEGFEESPQPVIEATPPAQGQLRFIGVSPNISTSIQVINGQLSQSKTIQFVYRYTFSAGQAGSYTIGPFQVSQNGRTVETSPLTLSLSDIPNADNQSVELILPEQPVYLGQRIPLSIEWWTSVGLRGKLMNQRMQVPLLDRLGEFQIEENVPEQANTTLVIDHASGSREHTALARLTNRNGEQYIVYTLDFIVTPLRAGDYEFAPTVLTVDEVVRWRRNVFGDRVPTHAQKRRVVGAAQTLSVKATPAAGKPASFAGAIGHGFSLEVTTDRSVVQVGDPITLTLTLRGDTAIDTLSLPPLSAVGLSPDSFRLPDDGIAGFVTEDGKRFQVTLRVLDEAVREIPPLRFSWFDPETGRYQTTRSQPIALSVRAAEVVSADDVISATVNESDKSDESPSQAAPEQEASSPGATGQAPDDVQRRPRFTLSGADLAIATDTAALTRSSGSGPGGLPLQIACYAAGLLVLGLAFIGRRRASLDPAVVARGNAFKQQRRRLEQAGTVREVAAVLRQMQASVGDLPRAEFDALIAECDDRIYAPGGASADAGESLRQRALALADTLQEAVR